MKSLRLELIVFICGATVMVYELVGSRVLAPYLGTSTFVWTSLIGVILGSLSIGYWAGGRLADRKAEREALGGIIFLAAAIIGITTYLKDTSLTVISLKISDLRWGSVLASVLLFSPPSVLLGMVSPYAVKLKLASMEEIGSTVGDLYALSTIGSIIGTFLAGFYLIPHFGTNNILVLISFSLTFVAMLALSRRMMLQRALMLLYCVVICLGGRYLDRRYNGPFPLADVDTEYSRVRISDEVFRKSITERGTLMRLMRMSNAVNSGIFHDNDDLLLHYTRYFRLVRHFRPDARTSLMIGGGAFVYPRDFLRQFPEATIDVVEIDQRLTQLSKQYFKLKDDPRLRIINEDGRTFLNRSRSRYDVLFCDAFASVFSIPYQLTTRESVQQMYRLLGDDGVAFINIISTIDGDRGRFLRGEYATFRSVFPHVYLFPVITPHEGKTFQNIMLVATKGKKPPVLESNDPELKDYLGHLWRKDLPMDVPVLTDNYAPVEHYVGI